MWIGTREDAISVERRPHTVQMHDSNAEARTMGAATYVISASHLADYRRRFILSTLKFLFRFVVSSDPTFLSLVGSPTFFYGVVTSRQAYEICCIRVGQRLGEPLQLEEGIF